MRRQMKQVNNDWILNLMKRADICRCKQKGGIVTTPVHEYLIISMICF